MGNKKVIVMISTVILLIAFVCSLVLFYRSQVASKNAPKEAPKEVLRQKKTEDLVDDFSYEGVELNPDYSSQGVQGVKTVEQYQALILDNSTVAEEGVKRLKGDKLVDYQTYLKEAISSIVKEEYLKSTTSGAKTAFKETLSKYFGGIKDNPLQLAEFVLIANDLKIDSANFYTTDEEGIYAFEFVVSDKEGHQLVYVTGYLNDSSMQFRPSYVLLLGYGQGFLNENLPKSTPPRTGL